MKFIKMNDRARAEEGYDYYVELMPVMPYASVAGVKAVLQILARRPTQSGDGNPEEFYDNSYLKKLKTAALPKSSAGSN